MARRTPNARPSGGMMGRTSTRLSVWLLALQGPHAEPECGTRRECFSPDSLLGDGETGDSRDGSTVREQRIVGARVFLKCRVEAMQFLLDLTGVVPHGRDSVEEVCGFRSALIERISWLDY
jgi:hypothetical protein